MSRRTKITDKYDCQDGNHRVVTLNTPGKGPFIHRTKPCEQCPWRADLPTGVFPPDAFARSASTAYDQAWHTFACHMQGAGKPATCAGFLLVSADHNLSVRLAVLAGRYDPDTVSDGGYPIYRSYRTMALANGVAPDDPALAACRDREQQGRRRR